MKTWHLVPTQDTQQDQSKVNEELSQAREEVNTLKEEVQKKQGEVSSRTLSHLLLIQALTRS